MKHAVFDLHGGIMLLRVLTCVLQLCTLSCGC